MLLSCLFAHQYFIKVCTVIVKASQKPPCRLRDCMLLYRLLSNSIKSKEVHLAGACNKQTSLYMKHLVPAFSFGITSAAQAVM